jgi:cytochrome b6-f complex iron-sulfur subunit
VVRRALPDQCPLAAVPAHRMSRRKWARLLLGTIMGPCAAVMYPILRYLIPPADIGVSATEALAATVGELAPNSGKTFRFGAKPALLVRLATGEYRSMSAVCTHLGCTVQYRSDAKQIWCACHNGCYDVNGKNVSGPPPRALDSYDVQVRGQEIYVIRKQAA